MVIFTGPKLEELVRRSWLSPDDDAEPCTLQYPQDALALLLHSVMLTVGFRLKSYNEDRNFDSGSVICLPDGWRQSAPNDYVFRYAHSQSSMEFLIKCSKMGPKTLIYGIALGDDKTVSCEISTADFAAIEVFPLEDAKAISASLGGHRRMLNFSSKVDEDIVRKLIPNLTKPGYEDAGNQSNDSASESSISRGAGPGGSLSEAPQFYRPEDRQYPSRRPYADFPPPGFEDEYEIGYGPRAHPRLNPGPFSIGHDDLNPPGLGPNPTITGRFFGEGGDGLPRPSQGGGFGGMHPTDDHPLFRGSQRPQGNNRGPRGSRWDPVGPGSGFGGFGSRDFI